MRVGTRTPGCEYPLGSLSSRCGRPNVVELGELITDRIGVNEVQLRDSFDLPTNPMTLTVSPLVASRPIEKQMVGMNVDLHSPPNRWHGQVKSDPPAAGQQERYHLSDDGHAAGA